MSEVALFNGNQGGVGLRLDPNMPYERFEELCATLGDVYRFTNFAIGDAINQGEELYGERAYQAFEGFNISEEKMAECARVSRKVPISIRHKTLSWSIHRAVAALPYQDQRAWLRKAADEHLSHHALRDELRESGGGSPPVAPARKCRCCGRDL